MPKSRIRPTTDELYGLAAQAGLAIQHDCGGYRVVVSDSSDAHGYRYVFPDTGICPTASRKQCFIFLMGAMYERKRNAEHTED
jgi:hypothetical protein